MRIWFFQVHDSYKVLPSNQSLSALKSIILLISSSSFTLKLASNAFESVSLFANEFG